MCEYEYLYVHILYTFKHLHLYIYRRIHTFPNWGDITSTTRADTALRSILLCERNIASPFQIPCILNVRRDK